jgi:hypothetical protein
MQQNLQTENGSTGDGLAQAARAINFSFAFALTHARGVNCLISVMFAEGRPVNKSFK